jgi:hypothetical protein
MRTEGLARYQWIHVTVTAIDPLFIRIAPGAPQSWQISRRSESLDREVFQANWFTRTPRQVRVAPLPSTDLDGIAAFMYDI